MLILIRSNLIIFTILEFIDNVINCDQNTLD